MRKEYPDYRLSGTEPLYTKLAADEKTILNKFLDYCRMTAGADKVMKIRGLMLQIRDVTQIHYSKLTREDIQKFLAVLNRSDKRDWTRSDLKVTLRRFLRWHYPDWNIRFDGFRDIRLKRPNTSDRINKATLISQDDLEKLLRTASSLRDKALLMLLYESGCRTQELRLLRWKDVNLDKDIGEVTFYSPKTKQSRTIPIKNSVIHLKRWYQEYSYVNVTPLDYIFPNTKKDRNTPMADTVLWYIVSSLGKKAGLNKRVYGYLFRHSRLTELYAQLPEQVHKKYAGHVKDSRQTATYSHIDDTDVMKAMIEKVYHVEELSPEKKHDLEALEKKINLLMEMNNDYLSIFNSLNDEAQFTKPDTPLKIINILKKWNTKPQPPSK